VLGTLFESKVRFKLDRYGSYRVASKAGERADQVVQLSLVLANFVEDRSNLCHHIRIAALGIGTHEPG